jgi:RNA polymerase sigma factor (sigma-70 family)
MLDSDAERALVLGAKTDLREREGLVERFLPRIASVARHYGRTPGIERRELMQEGVVGLLRALERYDPELDTPFWAYASCWVRQAMQRLVAERSGPVVLSDRAMRKLARLRDARHRRAQAMRRELTTTELAQATELTAGHIDSLLAAQHVPRPLDESVRTTQGDGCTLNELLEDPGAEDAFERSITQLTATRLPAMMARLDERERTVVAGRFGLSGSRRTLRELAQQLGISAERVRQIEQASLNKLHSVATAQSQAPQAAAVPGSTSASRA